MSVNPGWKRSALSGGTASVLLLLALTLPAIGQTQSNAPSDWSPEVAAALSLYRAGDYVAAQRVCTDQLEVARDVRVQGDAAALYALCLLRMPARADRQEGRVRLGQLTLQDPQLPDRPECSLALGIACVELAETAEALNRLDAAAAGFAARNEPQRLAAALVALADAWERHTEWAQTPPRLGVPRVENADQARAVRREQIRHVRDRLAQVTGSEDALAHVDRVLAQDFIAGGDRIADGVRTLEQIAAGPHLTPAVVEAIFALAEYRERERRWPEAVALYQRIAGDGVEEAVRRAGERIKDITQPQLAVEVAASVSAHEPLRVRLRVRNIEAVNVEVRRVELASWLTSRQGRLIEAALPEAGSVQLTRRLETRASQERDWWTSDALPEQVECAAAPGAYVVIVRAVGGGADATGIKRLVLVSDLAAVAAVGAQYAVVCAASPSPGDERITARFWMSGSFVPLEVPLDAGEARFPVPPEARVLREKRWVCLVQAGEHLALCRGELPHSAGQSKSPEAVLVGGPPEPVAGSTFSVAGLMLSDAGALTGSADDSDWQLEVRDTTDKQLCNRPLTVFPGGVFSGSVPIATDWDGHDLRIVMRRGGRVVENVRGRFALRVRRSDEFGPIVKCEVAEVRDPGATEVPVHIQAWYPWGAPLREAGTSCAVRAVGLPAPETGQRFATRDVVTYRTALDSRGAADLRVALSEFQLPYGPRAIAAWATVAGWENQPGTSFGAAPLGMAPPYAWLTTEPLQPRVGENVRFDLGWFDPAGRTGIDRPRLEVRGAPQTSAMNLYLDVDRLRSAPTRFDQPGSYEAVASLPHRGGGPPVVVSTTATVEADESAGDAIAPSVACEARRVHRDGRAGVQVRLVGTVAEPVMVLVEASEPLAARVLPRIEGTGEVFLPVDVAAGEARVVAAVVGRSNCVVAAEAGVLPEQPVTVEIDAPPAMLLPRQVAHVHVRCTQGSVLAKDATLIARLIRADGSGYVRWLPGEPRELLRLRVPGATIASSSDNVMPTGTAAASGHGAGGSGDERSVGGTTRVPLAPELVEALCAGATLWTAVHAINPNEIDLEVPLPDNPGVYWLLVLAVQPGGGTSSADVLLETQRGLRVIPDVPARLALGDRTLLTVMLENMQDEPIDARLRIDAGQGFHVESVRVEMEGSPADANAPSDEQRLTVPPRQRVWIQYHGEAVQVGAGTVQVIVDLPEGQQHAQATYEVSLLDQPAGPSATLRVKRSLSLLNAEHTTIDPATGEPNEVGAGATVWHQTPLESTSRLLPGDHLLVREEFTLAEPLPGFAWSQDVPPTCHAMQSIAQDQKIVGAIQRLRVDSLRFGGELAAGPHTHEYHIVVVRPGACRLPAPVVSSAGKSVTVSVEPAETLLNVVDVR